MGALINYSYSVFRSSLRFLSEYLNAEAEQRGHEEEGLTGIRIAAGIVEVF